MSLFTGDTKLLRRMRKQEDCEELQNDIKKYTNGARLEKWNLMQKIAMLCK